MLYISTEETKSPAKLIVCNSPSTGFGAGAPLNCKSLEKLGQVHYPALGNIPACVHPKSQNYSKQSDILLYQAIALELHQCNKHRINTKIPVEKCSETRISEEVICGYQQCQCCCHSSALDQECQAKDPLKVPVVENSRIWWPDYQQFQRCYYRSATVQVWGDQKQLEPPPQQTLTQSQPAAKSKQWSTTAKHSLKASFDRYILSLAKYFQFFGWKFSCTKCLTTCHPKNSNLE